MAISDELIEEALAWQGTPYHHQASRKGVGCDCIGLVIGVGRIVYGTEPPLIPPYTADWAEARGEETILNEARRWLEEVPLPDRRRGDMLAFRPVRSAPAKHVALFLGDEIILHAYQGHAVRREPLSRWWSRRLVSVFRFPEVPTWPHSF